MNSSLLRPNGGVFWFTETATAGGAAVAPFSLDSAKVSPVPVVMVIAIVSVTEISASATLVQVTLSAAIAPIGSRERHIARVRSSARSFFPRVFIGLPSFP